MSNTEPAVRPLDGRSDEPPEALLTHWRQWLGADTQQVSRLGGPPRSDRRGAGVTVVGSARREEPGWDGEVHPVAGVTDPHGNTVVSVATSHASWARHLVESGSLADLRSALPGRLGLPDHRVFRAAYRWSTAPPPERVLAPAGVWLPIDDTRVPEWLRPFRGVALISLSEDRPDEDREGDHDRGGYLAGVGLKRHDDLVHEIAVGTQDAARGRGLARRLVAQAARDLLEAGTIPTYMHDPSNVASARVAAAAGFPDRGWTALGLAPPEPDLPERSPT